MMRSSFEDVLERIDIVDVIAPHVKLRKAGRNFIGLCPFHKEKTPSFTVSAEKQIYYCFGCHSGGNAINFHMKIESLSFPEAVESLAKQFGIPYRMPGSSTKARLADGLEMLARYYEDNLGKSKRVREYLKHRGISDIMADSFRLGFSDPIPGRIGALIKSSSVPADVFLASGVIRSRDKDYYDMFRGRLIIPILDVNGKVIGFGGRTMEKDGHPKYINSPESGIFRKRSTLYGLNQAKTAIHKENMVIVVEGYFDVIALHQAGVRNVVSTLGTAITEDHLIRLKRYTENVTLMLDGDEAGVKSVLRLLPLVAETEVDCQVAALPEDQDPDSFVRSQGEGAVRELLASRRPLLEFFIDEKVRTGGGNFHSRLKMVREVTPFLDAIPGKVRRALFVRRLSELTGVDERVFGEDMNGERQRDDGPAEGRRSIIDEKVAGALLTKPALLQMFMERSGNRFLSDLEVKGLIGKVLSSTVYSDCRDVRMLVNAIDDESLRECAVRSTFSVHDYDDEHLDKIVCDFLEYKEQWELKKVGKSITEELAEAERKGDEKRMGELLRKKREVLSAIKQKSER